jgi:thiamine-monophosphate kinase
VLGSGDDASIAERSGAVAVSVDSIVEGIHFRLGPFAPADVGAKALAVALSDLAAMGAAPRDAYVQVGLPDGFGAERALELADGIGAVAAKHGVAVAGGDITRAPSLFVAVTVVGAAPSAGDLVTRAGAGPGDVLAVTGDLGGAAAGLELLRRPELASEIGEPVAGELRRRQLRPTPLIAPGAALARAGVSAMIDVSDGLAGYAGRIAQPPAAGGGESVS